MLESVKLVPRMPRKTCGGAFSPRALRSIRNVSERDVDRHRRRFAPSPGVSETSLSRGGHLSILIVTDTEFESGGLALFEAEHVRVVPSVSPVSVLGSQPLEELIPVGSETAQVTLTFDRSQPLSPASPETFSVIEGGEIELLSAAAGASATAAATMPSVTMRPLKPSRVASRAGLFQLGGIGGTSFVVRRVMLVPRHGRRERS